MNNFMSDITKINNYIRKHIKMKLIKGGYNNRKEKFGGRNQGERGN